MAARSSSVLSVEGTASPVDACARLYCPYQNKYMEDGNEKKLSKLGKGCSKKFKDFKAVYRHVQRVHLKHLKCARCDLRLGRDMNRHQRKCKASGDQGQGQQKIVEVAEPEVPQKALGMFKDFKKVKTMAEMEQVLIVDGEIVYEYERHNINEVFKATEPGVEQLQEDTSSDEDRNCADDLDPLSDAEWDSEKCAWVYRNNDFDITQPIKTDPKIV